MWEGPQCPDDLGDLRRGNRIIRLLVSLTHGFSRVLQAMQQTSRFNGFSHMQTVETVWSLLSRLHRAEARC